MKRTYKEAVLHLALQRFHSAMSGSNHPDGSIVQGVRMLAWLYGYKPSKVWSDIESTKIPEAERC